MYNPQLETFIRVADAGSFNKAAEESYITPTAVIKQINLLEEKLGGRLFDRTRRGLTLTKAGRSLYQDAKYIIQYCRDSVTRAKNAMQEDTNVIQKSISWILIFIAWMGSTAVKTATFCHRCAGLFFISGRRRDLLYGPPVFQHSGNRQDHESRRFCCDLPTGRKYCFL